MALAPPRLEMKKSDLVPVALLLLALAMLAGERAERLPSPKGWLSDAITSVQGSANRTVRNVSNVGVFFENLDALREENDLLRRRVEELMVQQVALQEVVAENELLRRELGFALSQPTLGLIGAGVEERVAAREPGNLIRAVKVSAGQNVGLLADMPVVTGRGLVGRVIEVGKSSAEVLLVSDPNSAVAALIQRTRAAGLVRGQLDGTLVMEGINRDQDVAVGDVVLTSGLGGVFPKGIVIGQVTEVIRSDTAMFQEAVVSPSVDLEGLELVLVVTQPQGSAASAAAVGEDR